MIQAIIKLPVSPPIVMIKASKPSVGRFVSKVSFMPTEIPKENSKAQMKKVMNL